MHTHPSSAAPQRSKPFLKWLGGKSALLPVIEPLLVAHGPFRRLIEPFVGGGSVFLGTDFSSYLVVDANPDLIELYRAVQRDVDRLMAVSRPLFLPAGNTESVYYLVREALRSETDPCLRAAYFLYLNKHGHRGMCRYNRLNQFNVPFGHQKHAPSLPEDALRRCAAKSANVAFVCGDFVQAFAQAQPGDVIYCDPPYMDGADSPSFRSYTATPFGDDQQQLLANLARASARQGVPVLISNHLTQQTRALYHGAEVVEVIAPRRVGAGRSLAKSVAEGLFYFAATRVA